MSMSVSSIDQYSALGAMGINNRGAMPPAPVPAGTPAPPGPATMMPDGTLGLVNCRAL